MEQGFLAKAHDYPSCSTILFEGHVVIEVKFSDRHLSPALLKNPNGLRGD
jgi:hypothetical protein